jgi:hypothetical protein
MVTLNDLKKHIKKSKRLNKRYNFLEFVENKDLSLEVESYFTLPAIGITAYDWVNGNSKLKQLCDTL